MKPTDNVVQIDNSHILSFASKDYIIPNIQNSDIPLFLHGKNTPQSVLALIHSKVDPHHSDGSEIHAPSQKRDRELIDSINLSQSCLKKDQKAKLRALLLQNRKALAFSMNELGKCDIVPMEIRVDEARGPISSRPYRYSPLKMDIIDDAALKFG